MTAQIHIPQPCTANWDEMTPTGNGRHCAQCCKTVTDFTDWETEEIIAYLQANNNRKICGRITVDQAIAKVPTRRQQLKAIWRSAAPVYKRIAAAIILFFSIESVAHAQVKARPLPKTQQNQRTNDHVIMGGIPAPVKRDTPVHKKVIMGEPAPVHHKPVPKKPKVVKPVKEQPPVIEQGEIKERLPQEK
ncbi:hypothetical protein ACTHGU_14865 [Chitinophagaceae bacterium MMS25-I14]